MNVSVVLGIAICALLIAGWVWLYPLWWRFRFAIAVWKSDIDYVRKALARGFPVQTPLPWGNNALWEALLVEPKSAEDQRPYEMVQQLLDAGADPNQQSETDPPPLIHAITKGNVAMVRLLVSRGARVDQPWGTRATPLHWALTQVQCDLVCPACRREVVQALLDAGASVNVSVHRRPSPVTLVGLWEEYEQKVQLEEGRSTWARCLETLESQGIQIPGVSDENREEKLAAHQTVVREVTSLIRRAAAEAL